MTYFEVNMLRRYILRQAGTLPEFARSLAWVLNASLPNCVVR